MARTIITKEVAGVASPLEWGRLASKSSQMDYLQAGIVDPSIMKSSRTRGISTAEALYAQTLDLQVPPRVLTGLSDTKR